MPTILRRGGLRVILWPNDHSPPHVHVFSATGTAKIALGEVRLLRIVGMNRQEAAKALELVFEHETELRAAWENLHGSSR
ncbi:MAG: DUF4160 domain-containing protein [Rhodocyclaceae bacterium]|nr:DUF4160 domain-containing protein [Rhodocyclaceae bacterium]